MGASTRDVAGMMTTLMMLRVRIEEEGCVHDWAYGKRRTERETKADES